MNINYVIKVMRGKKKKDHGISCPHPELHDDDDDGYTKHRKEGSYGFMAAGSDSHLHRWGVGRLVTHRFSFVPHVYGS